MTTKQTKTTKRTSKATSTKAKPAPKAKAGAKAKPVAGRQTAAAKRKPAKVVAQLSQRGESLVTFKGGELRVPNKTAAQLLVLQSAPAALTKVDCIHAIAKVLNFPLTGKISSSAGTFNVNDGFKFLESHGLTERAPIEGPGYGRVVSKLGATAKVAQVS